MTTNRDDLQRNYPTHIWDTRSAMKIGDKWEMLFANYAGPQNNSDFHYSKSNPNDDAWNHVDGICSMDDPVIRSWFPDRNMITVDTKAIKSLDAAAGGNWQCSSLLQEVKSVRRCGVTNQLADGWSYGDQLLNSFGMFFPLPELQFKTGFLNCDRADLTQYMESRCDVRGTSTVHVAPEELSREDRQILRWTNHYQVYHRIEDYKDLTIERDRTVLVPTLDILENVRCRMWWFEAPRELIYDDEAVRENRGTNNQEPTELEKLEKELRLFRSLRVSTERVERKIAAVYERRSRYPKVKDEDESLLAKLEEL